jgi:hypothetical protein
VLRIWAHVKTRSTPGTYQIRQIYFDRILMISTHGTSHGGANIFAFQKVAMLI